MGRLIVCSNCGKEFDENLEKCPSCGSTNPKGAERAYLNRLEDVREDMEELDDAPRAELERTIKKQGRLIKRVVLAVMAVTALLAERTEGKLFLPFVFSRMGNERDYITKGRVYGGRIQGTGALYRTE